MMSFNSRIIESEANWQNLMKSLRLSSCSQPQVRQTLPQRPISYFHRQEPTIHNNLVPIKYSMSHIMTSAPDVGCAYTFKDDDDEGQYHNRQTEQVACLAFDTCVPIKPNVLHLCSSRPCPCTDLQKALPNSH